MNGIVFDIQHYAVHDGPGIRTIVFLKGCPLRCVWCCNPESQYFLPQIRYFAHHCTQCLGCVTACSFQKVVSMNDEIQYPFEECYGCKKRGCIVNCNSGAVCLVGKEMESAQVIEIVARDIPFYRNSGGGVTFSGGEPLSQPTFLLELLERCKKLEIHTAIETSGWAEQKIFQQILPLTDLFLFDLKIIDPALHLEFTGKSVAPILRNLSFLASKHANIIIRVPLIEDITDTPSNIESISKIMAINGLKKIVIEPFHTLGKSKYEEIGLIYTLPLNQDYPSGKAEIAREFFLRRNFDCEIT